MLTRKASKLVALTWASPLILCLSQISCGQLSDAPLNKAQALQAVKVKSAADWKEIVSDEGRFRVIFPREPALNNDIASLYTYVLKDGDMKWAAAYIDFNQPVKMGESEIREAYRRSVAATMRNGATLLRQSDIKLNGKLGVESVIAMSDRTIYFRGFLIDNRMYTLEVQRNPVTNGDSRLPREVQQFFDSFTFWH